MTTKRNSRIGERIVEGLLELNECLESGQNIFKRFRTSILVRLKDGSIVRIRHPKPLCGGNKEL